jgi:hypothetical protein
MTSAASGSPHAGNWIPLTERWFLVPFVLIASLCFLWAFGVNLNDIPHLKKAFSLTDSQSSFIQVAFFGGYCLAALLAGWMMGKIGYQKGILMGLLQCDWRGAVSSRVSIALLWIFSLCVVCHDLWAEFLGSDGQPLRDRSRSRGKRRAQAKLQAVVQRRGCGPLAHSGPHVHSHLGRICACAHRSDEFFAQLESYRGSEAGTVKSPYLMIAGASDPRLAKRRNAVLIFWTFANSFGFAAKLLR